jgi:putative transposase
MKLQKAFKYRLKVLHGEDKLFRQYAGCTRFIWNHFLSLQNERRDMKLGLLSYVDMANMLPSLKIQYPFLKEAPSQALQQRLKELDRACGEALDPKNPKKLPQFKKKFKCTESFRLPQGFSIEKNVIFLPKAGSLPFFKSRDIIGAAKNCTVSEKCGHWYISVQTEMTVPDPVHPSSSSAGADRGLVYALALSDGKTYRAFSDGHDDIQRTLESMRRTLAKTEKGSESYISITSDILMLKHLLGSTLTGRIKKEQGRLARMVKRSRNWQKQKKRIALLYKKLSDARSDHLHKVSREVSKNHAVVVLEDLKIQNMTASARGTEAEPGKNVKQKAGLNRAILHQGWYELQRQLEYKEAWSGGMVLYVDPAYTSQTCSACSHVSSENRPSQELFYCVRCGHAENADINAAKVVKSRAGQVRVACGLNGESTPSEAGTARSTVVRPEFSGIPLL